MDSTPNHHHHHHPREQISNNDFKIKLKEQMYTQQHDGCHYSGAGTTYPSGY